MLKEIYKYRELLKTNVKKDIRGRYKASVLGVLWSFINPLLQVLVYAIVFPYLMKGSADHYVIYLVTGIIPWTFFQTVVNQSTTCIKSNSGIIKKVYFPRIILPLSAFFSGLINFFISCIIIVVFCLGFGIGISWHLIFLPVIAVTEGLFGLGLGTIFGAIDAYIQDTEYIVNFILMMAMYGAPVIYETSIFPAGSRIGALIQMNPMTHIMDAYRDIFMDHAIPDMPRIGIVFAVSLVLCIAAAAIFQRMQKGFAEQF
ncbi:ABC transporter permease [Candidatus Weimeria sp. HCP3S3_B5]|uniref:ABC transporter permease n=1 Tax=Candidatus Weimeria sp. HCP3S3_B5 TaxID=3438871 RepID=UPI003F897FF6